MSYPHQIERAEREIRRMRARIAEHKLVLNGMTVRGFPSQSATDALNKLHAELISLEQRAQFLRDNFRLGHQWASLEKMRELRSQPQPEALIATSADL